MANNFDILKVLKVMMYPSCVQNSTKKASPMFKFHLVVNSEGKKSLSCKYKTSI